MDMVNSMLKVGGGTEGAKNSETLKDEGTISILSLQFESKSIGPRKGFRPCL